jgi:uncharacterized protein YecT (DUF1311 family)
MQYRNLIIAVGFIVPAATTGLAVCVAQRIATDKARSGRSNSPGLPLTSSGVLMKKHMIAVLLYMSAHAVAANCADPKSQLEMTTCAGQEYASQDKKLNAAYFQYRTRLSESQKNQLKDAQVAWIKYKDLSCDFESSAAEGSSIHQMVRYGCLTEKTKVRLREVSKLMECKEGDLSCPAH